MADERRNPHFLERGPWPAVLLSFFVLAAFLPCLRNGFVSLDDPFYVTQNPHVKEGLTLASLKWAWGSTDAQNWHPLTWISHLLDVQLFGLNPEGHHATNVILHAVNAALLFLLLRRMTGAPWRSFAVAALFGVHPLRVESVAWISERKDVLSALFWLLTTWAYVRYAEKKRPRLFYGFSLGLFALGLMAKPMLVTLPFTLLLVDYWPLRRWPGTPVKRLVLEKIPFLALAGASAAVTFVVQQRGGAVTPVDTLNVSARLSNAAVAYASYLGKTAWPLNLCAMYPHPGHWSEGMVAGASLIVAAATALVLWRARAMPYLCVGWFWFLGVLAPVIGLVQIGRQAMADRYTYIPSIGLWIAIVWGADKLAERWRLRTAMGAVAAAAILFCLPLTVQQSGYWKDTRTLYEHAMKVTHRNWVVASSLASLLRHAGQVDEAVAMYQEALSINPYLNSTRCELADIYLERKRYGEALAQFQKAIELEPNDAYAHKGLGAVLQNMGRLDEAISEFNKAIRLDPNDADTYSDLGNCYGLKGLPDDALRCFETAVKLKPNLAANHRDLGVGLANKSRMDEAVEQFQKALELDPSDSQSRQFLQAAVAAKSAHH
ncbi:MAG TPA: tetratricopeptide repeat protein [Verrucomicrobiae bacterium]|jgi:tetratricopeptide (TPR) repeat protein